MEKLSAAHASNCFSHLISSYILTYCPNLEVHYSKTPLTVWQNGLASIKPLGTSAYQLDELFYHRVERKVRKDSTISYADKIYDVSYGLVQKQVFIVIEPHEERALYIENE